MALRRFLASPPVRSVLADKSGAPSRQWLPWFDLIGQRTLAVGIQDSAADPANLAPGATQTFTITADGVAVGDVLRSADFFPMTVGGVPTNDVRVIGNVTAANTVAVTFINVGAGAVDLDAGTIRIVVERMT